MPASIVLLAILAQRPDAGCPTPADVMGREEQVAVAGVVLPAKVDTGADRTTVHAERVEVRRNGSDSAVSFVLVGPGGAVPVHARVLRFVTVKSSNGERERRPVVTLELCLGAQRRKVEASLTDREAMRLPVLLGRDVLATGYLVDVTQQNLLGPPACR